MKILILIGTLFAMAAMAVPGADSLKRSFKDVSVDDSPTPVQVPCIECPCDGFTGNCRCILHGCCCNWENPSQPPAETWVPKV